MALPSCRAVLAIAEPCPGMQRLEGLRPVEHPDASEEGTRFYVTVGHEAPMQWLGYTTVDPRTTAVRRIELLPLPCEASIAPPRKRQRDPTSGLRRSLERLEPAALTDEHLKRIAASLDDAWRRVHMEQLQRTSVADVALSNV